MTGLDGPWNFTMYSSKKAWIFWPFTKSQAPGLPGIGPFSKSLAPGLPKITGLGPGRAQALTNHWQQILCEYRLRQIKFYFLISMMSIYLKLILVLSLSFRRQHYSKICIVFIWELCICTTYILQLHISRQYMIECTWTLDESLMGGFFYSSERCRKGIERSSKILVPKITLCLYNRSSEVRIRRSFRRLFDKQKNPANIQVFP